MKKQKDITVKFMNHNLDFLSSTQAQAILKEHKFKSDISPQKDYCIFIKIKDLLKIKNNIPLFLLDDEGTELMNSDIKKIMKDENIDCE